MKIIILTSGVQSLSICGLGHEWSWNAVSCVPVFEPALRRLGRQHEVMYEDVHECSVGFEWDAHRELCRDIDECFMDDDLCAGVGKTCYNLEGTYKCICQSGFESAIPDNIDNLDVILESDLDACVDIDECQLTCKGSGQICTNTIGSFDCSCQPGFELSDFGYCAPLDNCLGNPCGDNAVCRNLLGDYECDCFKDFHRNLTGNCVKADVCKTKGHVCQWKCRPERHDSFACECPPGFRLIGNTCSDINECTNGDICSEEKMCLNTHGAYTCKDKIHCPVGFSPIRGWKNEFERTKQDTNICHKDFHADKCGDKCEFDSIFIYFANLLNHSRVQSKLFRFFRMPSYGYSANYGYNILSVKNGNDDEVVDQEEFKIVPKYRGRPMAYLRLNKELHFNQDTNQKRDMTVEYYVTDRRSGSVLYKELIYLHVFVSEYAF